LENKKNKHRRREHNGKTASAVTDLSDALGCQPVELLDMDASVLSQTHFVANCIQATGAAGYRKWFDIGISEFRLLVVLSNEPGATGARVNEIMGLDLGAISRSLRKMESRGLVFSKEHPKHPSYRCWYVTKAGADLHDRVHQMTKEREEAILNGFSKAERFQLLSFLHRLFENTEALKQIAEHGTSSTTDPHS